MSGRLIAALAVAVTWACPLAGQLGTPLQPAQTPQQRIERILSDLQRQAGVVPHIASQRLGPVLARSFGVNGKRMVVYGDSLVDMLTASTEWPVQAVIGHEVGHHLAGHTGDPAARTTAQEAEADYFAGYLLASQGASLEESGSAVRLVLADDDPARAVRLAAIALGWCAAHQLNRSVGSAAFRMIPKDCAQVTDHPGLPLSIRALKPLP